MALIQVGELLYFTQINIDVLWKMYFGISQLIACAGLSRPVFWLKLVECHPLPRPWAGSRPGSFLETARVVWTCECTPSVETIGNHNDCSEWIWFWIGRMEILSVFFFAWCLWYKKMANRVLEYPRAGLALHDHHGHHGNEMCRHRVEPCEQVGLQGLLYWMINIPNILLYIG